MGDWRENCGCIPLQGLHEGCSQIVSGAKGRAASPQRLDAHFKDTIAELVKTPGPSAGSWVWVLHLLNVLGGLGLILQLTLPVLAAPIQRRPYLVLLMRKFRNRKGRFWQLAQSLETICRGMAVTMTVQDLSFKGACSPVTELHRRSATVGVTLACALALGAFGSDGWPATFIILGAFGAMGWYLDRGLLAHDLADTIPYDSFVSDLLLVINERRYRLVGTQVIKLHDDVWRAGVGHLLRHVHAAVIDVSEPSSNLEWEIRTAYASLPADSVILTWDVDRNPGWSTGELPIELGTWLRTVIDAQAFDRSIRVPHWTDGRILLTAYEWRELVARAIATTLRARTRQKEASAH
jgi:hypothetical protein